MYTEQDGIVRLIAVFAIHLTGTKYMMPIDDTSAFLLVLSLGTAIPMPHRSVHHLACSSSPAKSGNETRYHNRGVRSYPDCTADNGVEAEIDAEEAHAPILSYEYEHSSYYLPEPSSADKMNPARSSSRERGEEPNIHEQRHVPHPSHYHPGNIVTSLLPIPRGSLQ
ncbi:hypothetical protein BDN67DRAFT_678214 [Paxillus ammoniavirescens]|nr:hypothetical protein BDN67DRAFT_678214 [Paxillus ammoniavirescens]